MGPLQFPTLPQFLLHILDLGTSVRAANVSLESAVNTARTTSSVFRSGAAEFSRKVATIVESHVSSPDPHCGGGGGGGGLRGRARPPPTNEQRRTERKSKKTISGHNKTGNLGRKYS